MDISELLSHPHHMNPASAARYLEGFATAMAAVGHTALTISGYLDSAIHFGGWVETSGLDFKNINEQTIQAFGAHRCACPVPLGYAPARGLAVAGFRTCATPLLSARWSSVWAIVNQ